MTAQHLMSLAYPSTSAVPVALRTALAEDLLVVAIALREQAGIWRAADCRGLEAAIVAVADLAEQIAARAHAYQADQPC